MRAHLLIGAVCAREAEGVAADSRRVGEGEGDSWRVLISSCAHTCV